MAEYLQTTIDKFTFRVATDRRGTRNRGWRLGGSSGHAVGVQGFQPHTSLVPGGGARGGRA
jgi:hypothetical protein